MHLIDSLGVGGAERSLGELLLTLSAHDVEPMVVVSVRAEQGVHEMVQAAGIEVLQVTGSLPHRARTVRRTARRRSIDVVHSTLWDSNVLARVVRATGGPPLLTSLVNEPYGPGRIASGNVTPRKLELLRRFEAATSPRFTDHFHAISHAVADHFVDHVGLAPEDITVVGRGRDAARLGSPGDDRRAAARRALGLAPDEPVLLTVGRQEPQKAQWVLVEALALLRAQGDSPTLLLAGQPGSATADLTRRIAQHGLGEQVRVLGHRDDVPELLCAADAFVFPSLYEGFGGAVLEAMALRTPVIAADCPALREVLDGGRAGVLVPTGDARAMAAAIAAHLGGRDTTAEVTHGQLLFRERYAFDGVQTAMAELLHRTAGR